MDYTGLHALSFSPILCKRRVRHFRRTGRRGGLRRELSRTVSPPIPPAEGYQNFSAHPYVKTGLTNGLSYDKVCLKSISKDCE